MDDAVIEWVTESLIKKKTYKIIEHEWKHDHLPYRIYVLMLLWKIQLMFNFIKYLTVNFQFMFASQWWQDKIKYYFKYDTKRKLAKKLCNNDENPAI